MQHQGRSSNDIFRTLAQANVADAGFDEVSHPSKRRVVMRIDF